ncbi:glycosyltransferase family 2 protein [Phycisphaerales bacterium AB-hyl4]|uniref:Glycosyltransferase family 2 protein n=1 Tax=Natronomicrosphaera hydrolytica TaxID=3242702 RepID=A0ABV4U1X4_9BACT
MEGEALTIAVINHNGSDVLKRTLDALQKVTYRPLELLLVDDASTDGSDLWARQAYPSLRVVRMASNAGRPSIVRNRALREARSRYVLLLDHDVCLRPDAPTNLMKAMRLRPGVAATAPRLVYANDPNRLYGDGTNLHYLCISGFNARGQSIEQRPIRTPFPSLAGGNVLFDREVALWLGGYDEDYHFGWGEDAELCLRCRIAGFDVLHVPEAVGSHVERPRGLNRAEAQFYNRYRMMFTIYETRTLLLLAPALIVFEFCLLVLSMSKGTAMMYLRAIRGAIRDAGPITWQRAQVQATRMVGDLDLLEASPLISTGALAESRRVAFASSMLQGMFNRYWQMISRQLEP